MRALPRLPLLLALVTAGLVAGLWVWLGQGVPMPASPLGPGEKLPCVSYAPYRDGQSPFMKDLTIPEAQIDEDFAQLSKITACVRTYSIEKGLDKVPALARKHGLSVYLGIWIGPEDVRNREEIETAIRLANANKDVVSAIIVGNEVLLRGEQSAADLSAFLKEVRRRAPGIPITYADVWEFWGRNKSLLADVDFVTIHILPYWEDIPVSAVDAGPHVDQIRRTMADEFEGKEILIGETGWPSAGRMREGALPSPSAQARVMHDVVELARRQGYRVNVIEAFDQPWKRRSEGTVGGHWGLIDAGTREPKFEWGRPVSDFPAWPFHILLGVAAVALAFGAASFGARHRGEEVPTRDWIAVAGAALAGGAALGAAITSLPLVSLGIVGWLYNGAAVAVALATLAGVPALIAKGASLPALSTGLDPVRRANATPWSWGAALLLAAAVIIIGMSALGLVFDARYKDFPVWPFTAIAVPLAILAAVRPAERTGATLAEEVGFWGFLIAGLYVPVNETLANWQALWFGALCLLVAFTLFRVLAARRTR